MLLVMISIKLCLWFESIDKINATPMFRVFTFILIDDLFMQHASQKKENWLIWCLTKRSRNNLLFYQLSDEEKEHFSRYNAADIPTKTQNTQKCHILRIEWEKKNRRLGSDHCKNVPQMPYTNGFNQLFLRFNTAVSFIIIANDINLE